MLSVSYLPPLLITSRSAGEEDFCPAGIPLNKVPARRPNYIRKGFKAAALTLLRKLVKPLSSKAFSRNLVIEPEVIISISK